MDNYVVSPKPGCESRQLIIIDNTATVPPYQPQVLELKIWQQSWWEPVDFDELAGIAGKVARWPRG